MRKNYSKIVLGQIRSSFSRFLAILSITALGVGFLAGLQSTGPDMYDSMDQYYDTYHFFDINIKSTMGLTDKDVDRLKELEGIKKAAGVYSTDVLFQNNEGENGALRLCTANFADEELINGMNLLTGRLPQNGNECVALASRGFGKSPELGEEIVLAQGNEELAYTSFTVTGIADSPVYMSAEREPSTVGNGYIDVVIYVTADAVKADYYTDIYLLAENAKELNTFYDAYDALIEDTKNKIDTIKKECTGRRLEEIRTEAEDSLVQGRKEYEEAKAEAEEKLAEAETEIAEAEKELEDAEETLARTRQQLEEAKNKLDSGAREIAEAKAQYEEGLAEYEAGREALKESEAKIEESEQQLAALKGAVGMLFGSSEEKLQALTILEPYDETGSVSALLALAQMRPLTDEDVQPLIAVLLQQISDSEKSLAQGKQEFDYAKEELDAAQEQLVRAEEQIAENEKLLLNSQNEYNTGEKQYSEGLADYEEGKKELEKGREEYNTSKAEAEQELAEAEAELEEGEAEIDKLEKPSWYVLDRNTNASYVSFCSNAEKIVAIAKVFPTFFFLVAALVALTTMTRMVDEERVLIGTLKAIGYSNRRIAFKYVAYSFAAGVLGSGVGLAAGLTVLPTVIWNAYSMLYKFPKLILSFNPVISINSALALILCVVLATLWACAESLKEVPARLMLPRAPKAGKRVFLEHIKPIWSHLKFTHKVTARNILRYKKRFFMTVIGVAGCTALLLTGFGLKDAIGDIVNIQYGEIQKYDLTVNTEKPEPVIEYLQNKGTDTFAVISSREMTAQSENPQTIQVWTASSSDELLKVMNLRNRRSGESVNFDENSVVLTEKAAKNLGISAGESILLEDEDGHEYSVTVTGICEGYIYHYLYMTEAKYQQLFGETPEYNTLLAAVYPENEDTVMRELLALDEVDSAAFSSVVINSFDNMINKINYVVYVLIIAAGLLAFIVLYNLTNINIGERQKEIATIKVLGFYDSEVSAYICRETIILSLVGTAVGLILGIALCRYVVITAEMDDIMFGRNIQWLSYVLSAVITMLFSTLVNLIMYRKLQKISMVESLKSVD